MGPSKDYVDRKGAEAEEAPEGVAAGIVAETPETPEIRRILPETIVPPGIKALSTRIFPLVTGRGVACTSNSGEGHIFVRNRRLVHGKTSSPQGRLNETGTSSGTKTPVTPSTSIC